MRWEHVPVDLDAIPARWSTVSEIGLNPMTLIRLLGEGHVERTRFRGKNWYRRATYNQAAA